MKLGPPVLMTAVVSVANDSSEVLYDIARLSSPQRQALMVSEIRFYTDYPTSANPPAAGQSQDYVNMGYEVKATIHVGQMALADNVPVWSFAPVCDKVMESIQEFTGCFRWRFLKPLFLPSGMGFRVSVRRRLVPGVLSTYTVNSLPIWCSILGQTVYGSFPRTMNVPYAATYAPDPAASGRFVSTQQDLQNSTRSRLAMKYAVGRLAFVYPTSGIAAGDGPLAETWDVQDAGINVSVPSMLMCKGHQIIPAGTEFNAAFDHARRTLRLADFPLDPGDRMAFWAEYPTGTPTEWSSVGTPRWAPNVTIVGYRQENVP